MKILVGSENPVKIKATEEAFNKYFDDLEVLGIKAPSGVPDQPINEQTFEGAKNRATYLYNNHSGDFFVGIEGGIKKYYDKWFSFGAICIIDNQGRVGYGTSSHFELPENIVKKLLTGKELGHVMDELLNAKNVKQKQGAIGFFTSNRLTRKELYVPGIVVALIPFVNPLFYGSHNPKELKKE